MARTLEDQCSIDAAEPGKVRVKSPHIKCSLKTAA